MDIPRPKITLISPKAFFVFDVESVGLYGEGFAVAGGCYLSNGTCQWEFEFATYPMESMAVCKEDYEWVIENIPMLKVTHRSVKNMRSAFWEMYLKALAQCASVAADCLFPVESTFFNKCIFDNYTERRLHSPYPFLEISSFLLAANMDPLEAYHRKENELPKHNPLADARQSARLLSEAIQIIHSKI